MKIIKKLVDSILGQKDPEPTTPKIEQAKPTPLFSDDSNDKRVVAKRAKVNKVVTNIKPTNILYTNLNRENLSEKITTNEVQVYKQDENSKLIDLNSDDNAGVQLSKELSSMRYKIEHPIITDLACSLYTLLTTNQYNSRVFKNVQRTHSNGLKFVIEKTDLIKIMMGNAVSQDGYAIDGAGNVRKHMMSILSPLLTGKQGIPFQIINLPNYELPDGTIKDLILKIPPIKIHSVTVDVKTTREYVEMELNGLLYPVKKVKNLYRANTTFIHTVSNLSVVLSVGEDIYLQSKEFQKTNKKTRYDIARRYMDFIQLCYNSKYNIPECSSVIDDTRFIINCWGDTLKSLMPSAYRTRGTIRRNEIVQSANLSSVYFHLGLNFLNRKKQVQSNEFLVIPDKKCFCVFEKPSDTAVFYCHLK